MQRESRAERADRQRRQRLLIVLAPAAVLLLLRPKATLRALTAAAAGLGVLVQALRLKQELEWVLPALTTAHPQANRSRN